MENFSEKDNGQYQGASKENYDENSKAQQAQTQLENAALKEWFVSKTCGNVNFG
jgi:hypothetical protein